LGRLVVVIDDDLDMMNILFDGSDRDSLKACTSSDQVTMHLYYYIYVYHPRKANMYCHDFGLENGKGMHLNARAYQSPDVIGSVILPL